MANMAIKTMTKEEQIEELLGLRAELVEIYINNFSNEKNPAPFQQIRLPLDEYSEEQELREQMTLHL